jgi:hypothetical protein
VALCAEWRLRAGLKTFDQNEVKDFYEMEDWKQCELLIELIELIGSNDVRSLEELSKKEVRRPRRFGRTYAKLAGSSSAPFLSEY